MAAVLCILCILPPSNMGVANTAVHGACIFVVVVQNIVFSRIWILVRISVYSQSLLLTVVHVDCIYILMFRSSKNGNIKLKKTADSFL